jgi:DnaJ-class molecular chaperone
MNEETKKQIDDILSSKSVRETLGFNNDLVITEQMLKKRYRILAVKVHPDKSNHTQAGEAFQKLHTAFESLLEQTQQSNKNNVTISDRKSNQSKQRENHSKKGKEHNLKEQYEKRWKEEEFKFHFNQSQQKELFKKRKLNNIIEKNFFVEELNNMRQELINDDDYVNEINERSHSWKKFSSHTHNSNSNIVKDIHLNEIERKDYDDHMTRKIRHDCYVCLLCRRQFQSYENIQYHNLYSTLHDSNMKNKK